MRPLPRSILSSLGTALSPRRKNKENPKPKSADGNRAEKSNNAAAGGIQTPSSSSSIDLPTGPTGSAVLPSVGAAGEKGVAPASSVSRGVSDEEHKDIPTPSAFSGAGVAGKGTPTPSLSLPSSMDRDTSASGFVPGTTTITVTATETMTTSVATTITATTTTTTSPSPSLPTHTPSPKHHDATLILSILFGLTTLALLFAAGVLIFKSRGVRFLKGKGKGGEKETKYAEEFEWVGGRAVEKGSEKCGIGV